MYQNLGQLTDHHLLRVTISMSSAGTVEDGLKSNTHNVVSVSNLASY